MSGHVGRPDAANRKSTRSPGEAAEAAGFFRVARFTLSLLSFLCLPGLARACIDLQAIDNTSIMQQHCDRGQCGSKFCPTGFSKPTTLSSRCCFTMILYSYGEAKSPELFSSLHILMLHDCLWIDSLQATGSTTVHRRWKPRGRGLQLTAYCTG